MLSDGVGFARRREPRFGNRNRTMKARLPIGLRFTLLAVCRLRFPGGGLSSVRAVHHVRGRRGLRQVDAARDPRRAPGGARPSASERRASRAGPPWASACAPSCWIRRSGTWIRWPSSSSSRRIGASTSGRSSARVSKRGRGSSATDSPTPPRPTSPPGADSRRTGSRRSTTACATGSSRISPSSSTSVRSKDWPARVAGTRGKAVSSPRSSRFTSGWRSPSRRSRRPSLPASRSSRPAADPRRGRAARVGRGGAEVRSLVTSLRAARRDRRRSRDVPRSAAPDGLVGAGAREGVAAPGGAPALSGRRCARGRRRAGPAAASTRGSIPTF